MTFSRRLSAWNPVRLREMLTRSHDEALGICGVLSIVPRPGHPVSSNVLAARTGSRVGLLRTDYSGLSLPLLYVAFVNASAPGSCSRPRRASPRMNGAQAWLAIGILLLVSGSVWIAIALTGI